jgi:hypothetical protein
MLFKQDVREGCCYEFGHLDEMLVIVKRRQQASRIICSSFKITPAQLVKRTTEAGDETLTYGFL